MAIYFVCVLTFVIVMAFFFHFHCFEYFVLIVFCSIFFTDFLINNIKIINTSNLRLSWRRQFYNKNLRMCKPLSNRPC